MASRSTPRLFTIDLFPDILCSYPRNVAEVGASWFSGITVHWADEQPPGPGLCGQPDLLLGRAQQRDGLPMANRGAITAR